MSYADIQGSVVRNANPQGCVHYLADQWHLLQQKPKGETFNNVLVIGASSGFGLASRLANLHNGSQFSLGVCYERAPTADFSGSAGWHLNEAFLDLASKNQHQALTLNSDCFLSSTKAAVIEQLQRHQIKIDLIIYSVAAGIKLNANGEKIRSAILPIGHELEGYQLDLANDCLLPATLPAASDEQIDATVDIMGGSDWMEWMQVLSAADVLDPKARSYAYSYLGSELNEAIYSAGTLGRAKADLHQTADVLQQQGFNAQVVVAKALVTKASLFIPTMAPYLMALNTALKARDQHEDVFQQMYRLFSGGAEVDGALLRLDQYELQAEVQAEIAQCLATMDPAQFQTQMDFQGVKQELLAMHGWLQG